MKILVVDTNHPVLNQKLIELGCEVEEDYTSDFDTILQKINQYHGVVIRSRIPINKQFLEAGSQLKFIARVGAGMENIEVSFAATKNIKLIHSPEGNRDAVAEHCLAMLLSIMNRIIISTQEVKNGIWKRAENRGDELMGKTIGLIGYGVMGKAFAKRLSGFGVKVIFHDLLPNIGDENAQQVHLETLKENADILSLHTPLTPLTYKMVNKEFINSFKKNIYFINTARGQCVETADVVLALESGKIKGVCLDVLEYEKASFETIENQENKVLHYLLHSPKAIVTPHIAGWTHQSNKKMAEIIVQKIKEEYFK